MTKEKKPRIACQKCHLCGEEIVYANAIQINVNDNSLNKISFGCSSQVKGIERKNYSHSQEWLQELIVKKMNQTQNSEKHFGGL